MIDFEYECLNSYVVISALSIMVFLFLCCLGALCNNDQQQKLFKDIRKGRWVIVNTKLRSRNRHSKESEISKSQGDDRVKNRQEKRVKNWKDKEVSNQEDQNTNEGRSKSKTPETAKGNCFWIFNLHFKLIIPFSFSLFKFCFSFKIRSCYLFFL